MKKFPFSQEEVSKVQALIRENLVADDKDCVYEYGQWHSTDGESFQAVIYIEENSYTFEITLGVTCLGELFSW